MALGDVVVDEDEEDGFSTLILNGASDPGARSRGRRRR